MTMRNLFLWCAMLFLFLSWLIYLANGYGNNPSPLLRAIEQVESRGSAVALGDGGEAVGILQIHRVLVDDCNRILGEDRFAYDDRWDVSKSREMFRVYTEHYSPGASDEVIARRWNGGPRGEQKAATEPYWERVRNELDRASFR